MTKSKLIEKEEAAKHTLTEEQSNQVKALFEKALNNSAMKVEIESLPAETMPVTITMEEWMRRMKEMSQTGGGGMMGFGNFPEMYNLVINSNAELASKLIQSDAETQEALVKQALDLAKIAQGLLKGEELKLC